MTVMQKWTETKSQVVSESKQVAKCLVEAMEIIKDFTGQRVLNLVTFGSGDTKVTIESHCGRDFVKIYADGVPQYVEQLDPAKHWYGTLGAYQSLIEVLRKVNTGAIVSAWENQQE